MPHHPALFTPVHLGDLALPNRVVMAPMTRSRAGASRVPPPMTVKYYVQRASAGLLVTEAAQVSEQGIGYPSTPGIHEDAQVIAWRAVTDAVHAAGGRIVCQLFHAGRISHPDLQPDGERPVAPSAVRPAGRAMTARGMVPFGTPRALATWEMAGIVAQFAHAARAALRAGFDGVEIHAANGYLLDQFLRDGTNQRTDAYGGDAAGRARLLLEVTEAVVAVCGGGRVGVRLSPVQRFNDMRDTAPQATFEHAAAALGRFDLAYLHGVESGVETQPFDFAAFRRRFPGPYLANGSYDGARAAELIGQGRADAVSFGLPFIANPDLPRRLREGLPLAEVDETTLYGGDERGYTDYPPHP